MEQEAAKRKERLSALKRKVAGEKTQEPSESQEPAEKQNLLSEEGEGSLKSLLIDVTADFVGYFLNVIIPWNKTCHVLRAVFRSYNPLDPSLKETSLPEPGLVDLEEHIEEQLQAAKDTSVMDEMDLTTLAPRKIDWDLKRAAEKKLQRLERRTQRAIAELIRERLVSGKQDLLVTAVNQASEATQRAHDSDED